MHHMVVLQSKAMAKIKNWKGFVFDRRRTIVAFLMWYWSFFIKGVTLNELKDTPVIIYTMLTNNVNEMKTRNHTNYVWPGGRPIDFSFGETDEETCIEFNENPNATDRLEFIRGRGCYSHLGQVGGAQPISIGKGCEDVGTVLHEIGHALGLDHEHQRLDRDDYIQVNTKNNACSMSDLNKVNLINEIALPFDLGSIMHYDSFACSIIPIYKTITTHDPRYQHTIGQVRSFSFLDVKRINLFYCEDTCADTKIQCINGGYPNPRACNQCKCPSGLGSPSCLNVEETEGCGGELEATNRWQSLTFNERRRCVWRVSAQRNSQVRLILEEAKYRCDEACTSFVEIKHTSDFQTTGFRSCCGEHDVETISDGNQVLIIHDARELNRNGVFSLRFIQAHNSTAKTSTCAFNN
ncbi:Metalloendopeptidase [Aphelenchoides besseyi]|nr:Metalloendopeptidase [Aphelenchoides besseyi]